MAWPNRLDKWTLPIASAATVLISSYLVRTPTLWRQAPITVALVIASWLSHHSRSAGVEFGLIKVVEVLFRMLRRPGGQLADVTCVATAGLFPTENEDE